MTEFTVTFNPNNGGEKTTSKVTDGGKVTKPADPAAPEGKEFEYWADKDGNEYDFNGTVTASFELTAKYKDKIVTPPPATEFTVTFNPNNGGEKTTAKVTDGGKVTKPADPAAPEGKEFEYWADKDGNEYDFNGTVTADFELTAKYKDVIVTPPATEFTVTFNPNNADEPTLTTVKVAEGGKVAKPADPVHPSGKTFKYWTDEDGVEYDFDTAVTADVTVIAAFAWKVTFAAGEGATGTVEPVWEIVWKPSGITLPDGEGLTNGDKVFDGWTDGTNNYKAGATFVGTENHTLTAVWKDAPPENVCVVTFDPNNAGATWTVNVTTGEKVTKPDTDPEIEGGKLFRYWEDEEGAEYDFDSVVTEDITLTARFGYRITFSLGEGVEGDAPATLWAGFGINLPNTVPVREGYTFKGWTDGTDTYQPGARVNAKTLDLTAVWEEQTAPPVATYTVTFRKANTWDSEVLATISGDVPTESAKQSGEKFTLPENPFTRQYYAFGGWSDGADTYQAGDEYTVAAKNVSLYAVWIEVFYAGYTENYDGYLFLPDTRAGSYTDGEFTYYDGGLDVGEDSNPFVSVTIAYTIADGALSITSPFTAEGTVATGGVNISITYKGTTYVFGTPARVEPTVTFDANGGSGEAPSVTPVYNDNSGMYKITLPANPYTAPEGKVFKCWSVNDSEYAANKSFFANSGETVTIKAVWEDAPVEPVYNGVTFEGSCTVPTQTMVGTIGGETYVKFIVDTESEEKKVVYFTSDGAKGEVPAEDYSSSQWKPDIYGSDALYYNVQMASNIAYYLVIKADLSKLSICDNDDNLLENSEFIKRAEDSDWVTVPTDEDSDFYKNLNVYFAEAVECDGVQFLGMQLSSNSIGIVIKPIYVSNGAEKVGSSLNYKGSDSENGSLLVFESATVTDAKGYRIKIGKKSDGNYYVAYLKYKNTSNAITEEKALTGTQAPAF